ncbi:LANO_0H15764g1_1 [Lachancea nothofagi CBS 11611]|uniref:Diacylglycerol O-acyltransferase n=1 Tax=Lachancea nothofagi CBS 11611 TaxID=1266666 RepID=A0A1G4KMN5_9SACH|nr:LANO_0H15764g1_1 [Lachancea nothofagi CBS 11611]
MDSPTGMKFRGKANGKEAYGKAVSNNNNGKANGKVNGKVNGKLNGKQGEAHYKTKDLVEHELEHIRLYGQNCKDGKQLSQIVGTDGHKGLAKSKKPKFCSVKTPWKRRLQTLAVAWHVGSFVYILAFAILALANPIMWVIMVPYMVYYATDRSPSNGNVTKRYSPWVRSLPFWRYYCEYYPIHLHKTADLIPSFTEKAESKPGLAQDRYLISFRVRLWPFKYSLKFNILKLNNASPELEATGPRYIFGYHPHGVAALGAFGAFATEGADFSMLFPGVRMCLMTLINQFQIPFYRDYLLSLGITTVSKKNALRVLQQNYSTCIVVGGAQEALLSKIGSADLVLKRRKGFIKLALETGNVGLVPCFAFGETDCYNILQTDEKSYLRKMQIWFKKSYGFTIPFFFARGLFNYDFGLIPFRKPINVVTGRPIYVKEKFETPSIEDIDYYQDLYIEELKRIFYTYKEQFGCEDQVINFVE